MTVLSGPSCADTSIAYLDAADILKTMEKKSDKPVLVLLHAFQLHSAMWDPQRRLLEKKFRLFTPDLPGFGKKRTRRAASIGTMADFTAKELRRMKIEEPVVLGGLSMGGYVALEFIKRHPGRVRALILCATRSTPDSPEARKKRAEQIKLVRREGVRPLMKAMVPKLLGTTSLRSRPSVVRAVKRLAASAPASGVAGALRAMAARRDNTPTLRKFKNPVLILAGKEDTVIPIEEIQKMRRAARTCTYRLLPRTGHLLSLESPELFSEHISKFIPNIN